MNANPIRIDLDLIRTDGGTQSRAFLNQNVINEYADLINKNDLWKSIFPPITVFYDGSYHWLADGFHRLEAAKKSGLKNIDCFVNQGTQRDAILFSVGANAEHGLRRNDDDKRRAVTTLLNDNEWNCWSDNQIAKKCKVSQPFVSKVRKELGNSTVNVDSKEQRTYERNGKTHNMKTNNIGRSQLTKENQDRDSNTKEMFNSEQFKEAVKKELENSHPELAERFDQDVEVPSYNVISEELFLKKEFIKGQAEKIAELEKLLDLSDKFYKQAEYSESKMREELAKVELELREANQKIAELTETNNQLFSANENLTKELNEIKSALGLENEPIEEIENEITLLREYSTKFMSINAAIERASLRLGLDKCINENQNKSEYFFQRYRNLWKENVDNAIKVGSLENEIKEANQNIATLNEWFDSEKEVSNQLLLDNEKLTCEIKNVNNKLKIAIKPNGYDQLDKMLVLIQNEFEYSLEKGAKKREGIRIGRTASNELLNAIKQARGVE